MNDSPTLGETLRDARLTTGISMRRIALEVGVTPAYMSDIENDNRVPADEVMQKLCTLVGVDFEHAMALGGRLGQATKRYLKRHPDAVKLFRLIAQRNLSDDDLRHLSDRVSNLVERAYP